MTYLFVSILLFLMIVALLLQIISLPGNWIILVFLVVWKFIGPIASTVGLTWPFLLFLVGLAALGELAEWIAQLHLGKRHGSTARGNIGGILGAITGAILMLPLFFGFGALLGALIGAYLGCLAMELLQGRPAEEARKAAWGVMVGRFWGSTFKLGVGITIIWLAVGRIWPQAATELIAIFSDLSGLFFL